MDFNFKESYLHESWWRNPKGIVKEIVASGKTYKYWKNEGNGGPSWILQSRNGARYGLYTATEGNFHIIRMKKGKKYYISPKGGKFLEYNSDLQWIEESTETIINEGVFKNILKYATALGIGGIISLAFMNKDPSTFNPSIDQDNVEVNVSDNDIKNSQQIKRVLSLIVQGHLSREQTTEIANNISQQLDQPEISDKLIKLFNYAHDNRGSVGINEYDLQYEELDEDEILDERKYEKIKMARTLLKSKGNNKAFARHPSTGKYILKSKDIRKLMRKLKYVFSDKKGKWILDPKKAEYQKQKYDQAINPSSQQSADNSGIVGGASYSTQDDTETIVDGLILVVVTPNPWHKGHDLLLQKAIKLKSNNAKIIIVPTIKWPYQQEILSIYENDNILIHQTPISDFNNILELSSKYNDKITHILCGKDQVEQINQVINDDSISYESISYDQSIPEELDSESKEKLENKINNLIQISKDSDQTVIPSSLINNNICKILSKEVSFDKWFIECAPFKFHQLENIKQVYNILYTNYKSSMYESVIRKIFT